MFNLIVVVRDQNTKDAKELVRSFDPTLAAATLQQKWNGLGPAVLQMINDLQATVAADTNTPQPL